MTGLTLCACMGPVYGDPYCPCRMAELGLPSKGDEIRKKEWEQLREVLKRYPNDPKPKEDNPLADPCSVCNDCCSCPSELPS